MNHLKNQSKTKTSIIVILVLALFTLGSCGSSQNESKQTPAVPVLPQNQEQIAVPNPEPEQPVSAETTTQPTEVQESGEVMLNPPHGEPFHRCDIPVGAPLTSASAVTTRQTNSDPVQATAPQSANTAPSVTNNPTAPTIENAMRMNPSQTRSTAPANSGTKPRLNPPHGQPWHRCDIAVDSPLP